MKALNNIKLANSFREISNALEIVSMIVKVFALVIVVLQGVMLVKETKSSNS